MADDQHRQGGIGRLFTRAQQRRRERRRREQGTARPGGEALPGGEGEERALRTLHERSAMAADRARVEDRQREEASRRFSYRETGGGYGGYGGTADRSPYAPRQGRYGAGYTNYGPMQEGARRSWESGGSTRPDEEFGETWRGGEFRGGREHWRGAEFRGGGAETWRRRRERARAGGRPQGAGAGGPERGAHPHGLGAGAEGREMERGHLGPPGWAYRPGPTDKPHGLGGAYDDERIPVMERGLHPESPGSTMVEPLGSGSGGYGGARMAQERGISGGQRGRDFEEEALHASRVGPGSFRRRGGAGYGRQPAGGAGWEGPGGRGPARAAEGIEGQRGGGRATFFGGDTPFERDRPRDAGTRSPAYVGEHRGRNWEGDTDAARTGAWYGGEAAERTGWRGSGPGSEHTADWYGGPPASDEESSAWYGGGLHEAREDRVAQDFGSLGGPDHGRYGRELPADDGGGRGFGGPLGRWQDRDRGEQGRLYDGQYRGREDDFPMRGEAIAGRGHVGTDDFRDLTVYGEGGADRGSRERYRRRHEEPDHYRGR